MASEERQLKMINILLPNNAEKAKKVVAEYNVPFVSTEEFFAYLNAINREAERIVYIDENSAEIQL